MASRHSKLVSICLPQSTLQAIFQPQYEISSSNATHKALFTVLELINSASILLWDDINHSFDLTTPPPETESMRCNASLHLHSQPTSRYPVPNDTAQATTLPLHAFYQQCIHVVFSIVQFEHSVLLPETLIADKQHNTPAFSVSDPHSLDIDAVVQPFQDHFDQALLDPIKGHVTAMLDMCDPLDQMLLVNTTSSLTSAGGPGYPLDSRQFHWGFVYLIALHFSMSRALSRLYTSMMKSPMDTSSLSYPTEQPTRLDPRHHELPTWPLFIQTSLPTLAYEVLLWMLYNPLYFYNPSIKHSVHESSGTHDTLQTQGASPTTFEKAPPLPCSQPFKRARKPLKISQAPHHHHQQHLLPASSTSPVLPDLKISRSHLSSHNTDMIHHVLHPLRCPWMCAFSQVDRTPLSDTTNTTTQGTLNSSLDTSAVFQHIVAVCLQAAFYCCSISTERTDTEPVTIMSNTFGLPQTANECRDFIHPTYLRLFIVYHPLLQDIVSRYSLMTLLLKRTISQNSTHLSLKSPQISKTSSSTADHGMASPKSTLCLSRMLFYSTMLDLMYCVYAVSFTIQSLLVPPSLLYKRYPQHLCGDTSPYITYFSSSVQHRRGDDHMGCPSGDTIHRDAPGLVTTTIRGYFSIRAKELMLQYPRLPLARQLHLYMPVILPHHYKNEPGNVSIDRHDVHSRMMLSIDPSCVSSLVRQEHLSTVIHAVLTKEICNMTEEEIRSDPMWSYMLDFCQQKASSVEDPKLPLPVRDDETELNNTEMDENVHPNTSSGSITTTATTVVGSPPFEIAFPFILHPHIMCASYFLLTWLCNRSTLEGKVNVAQWSQLQNVTRRTYGLSLKTVIHLSYGHYSHVWNLLSCQVFSPTAVKWLHVQPLAITDHMRAPNRPGGAIPRLIPSVYRQIQSVLHLLKTNHKDASTDYTTQRICLYTLLYNILAVVFIDLQDDLDDQYSSKPLPSSSLSLSSLSRPLDKIASQLVTPVIRALLSIVIKHEVISISSSIDRPPHPPAGICSLLSLYYLISLILLYPKTLRDLPSDLSAIFTGESFLNGTTEALRDLSQRLLSFLNQELNRPRSIRHSTHTSGADMNADVDVLVPGGHGAPMTSIVTSTSPILDDSKCTHPSRASITDDVLFLLPTPLITEMVKEIPRYEYILRSCYSHLQQFQSHHVSDGAVNHQRYQQNIASTESPPAAVAAQPTIILAVIIDHLLLFQK